LSRYDNIRFFESDFLRFSPAGQYDFFFSSRAIEYFPDKKALIGKISGLLKSGGQGFIITKTPKYLINKILGRKPPKLHRGQISPRALKSLLRESGCRDMEMYPVTMSFPIFKSVFMSELLHKIFYRRKLNFISQFFSESYSVKFTKNDY